MAVHDQYCMQVCDLVSRRCGAQASEELKAMRTKQTKLEYRIQHLVRTVADSDAALLEALEAEGDRRAQLRERFAYLKHSHAAAVAPAAKIVEPA